MRWKIIDSGRMLPHLIMDKDAALLANMKSTDAPLLHLYEWAGNCLTYGYFTNPSKYLNSKGLSYHQIQMARRPTGGGIIFHLTDFAFSILIPSLHPNYSLNTLENYAFVNQLILEMILSAIPALTHLQLLKGITGCINQNKPCFCMAIPTQYDIIVDGKKIGGAAQRRTKKGFLHQGSISLSLPDLSILNDVLNYNKPLIESMNHVTYPLLDFIPVERNIKEAQDFLKKNLTSFISKL